MVEKINILYTIHNTVWQNFICPSFDDRVVEVVAVFNSVQLGMSRVFNPQRHRIAQVCQLDRFRIAFVYQKVLFCIQV